ncbi:hypothetical protein [Oscillatoria salina]|uniref:hypothetical protein n=1 Tax=Oscillatoria salina TaxID=331517 RepID=UPI0013BDE3C5|nr:hypothetical protein [Oscillatoria salina]MBZ8179728.1 hypothetical protein [Oscillatoria salina IIICB1]NET87170.1 hypothetical protein [Kamptonema sp. SIO1D9]
MSITLIHIIQTYVNIQHYPVINRSPESNSPATTRKFASDRRCGSGSAASVKWKQIHREENLSRN